MNTFTCAEVLAGRAPQDRPIVVKGWVRTRRDSKAGISFIHVSDGSCFHPVQAVASNTLPNYANEVVHLNAGCSVAITGMVVPSPAKGQPFEVQASAVDGKASLRQLNHMPLGTYTPSRGRPEDRVLISSRPN